MNLTPIADVKHKKNSGVHQYVVDYPRYCDLCNHDMKKLSNRFEFAQHLRALHSTREGGSFICRYGPNGVCQTLPLEGVSDHDYEAHIRKFHSTIGMIIHFISEEIE
ncbi:unnamed protein product [Thelazia callipaeda]|uniref:C2H2-type domain-containing protein n=1 Tax=Thelazia callipaeda TaxID=103827 RepID=A0A0N5DA65_THECL|nr:unnamed protein product [Thelazia callipaeda]